MKTVFDNKMCAHVWAQQNQAHGRSNSMHFQGDTIYSYQTPIARIVFPDNSDSPGVVLITSHTYSVTTSGKHMPAVHRAVQHLKSFHVPNLGVFTVMQHDGGAPDRMHEDNYAHYVKLYAETMQKLSRARQGADHYVATLGQIKKEAEDYVDTFNLRGDKPMSLDDDFPIIDAEVVHARYGKGARV